MENLDLGLEIISLTIGEDQKDGMRFSLGTKVGKNKEMEVSVITVDEDFYIKYGLLSYVVFVRKEGQTEDLLWKRYTDVPCSVVYKI